MQTLQEQIKQRQQEMTVLITQETMNKFLNAIDGMVEAKLAKDAIRVGETLPNGQLVNVSGGSEGITEIIKRPTVISFYRGTWCPYCNLELQALQNILPQIQEKGAHLIAISPEKPDSSLTFKEKMALEFDVYTDHDNAYARKLGLVLRVDDMMNEEHKKLGFDLEAFNGISTQELPFGATFIVDTNGKITYAFVKEDYTKRAEPLDILKALDQLS